MQSNRKESVMFRKVKYLIPAYAVDMSGFPVKQSLPTNKVEKVDPFLLLHHAKSKYNSKARAIHQGIGPHPHRGFSPVTFVIEGEVHHRDSRGNSQIAKKGDVQWMHAGAGIIHSERPSQALVEKKERQEIVQLWINTPAAKKMQQPRYQFLAGSEMPVFISEDGAVLNKLVAGSYKNLESKTVTESKLLIVWSSAQKAGKQTFQLSELFNLMLYVIRGKIHIREYGLVEEESLVVFENNADLVEILAEDDALFLLMAGEPLNEKVTQHGPFVMNTTTEILEAMRDYQMGKMGILIEEK